MPVRVLIIGGGLGGCSAAWALSRTPTLRANVKVTLFQPGWRLGGKGASGRNAQQGNRIEEHGLHMFMGWYDRSFYMLREVYKARPSFATALHPTALEAFTGLDRLYFGQPGKPDFWDMPFPSDATELPGEQLRPDPGLRVRAANFVRGLVRRLGLPGIIIPGSARLDDLLDIMEVVASGLIRLALPAEPAYRANVLVDLVLSTLKGLVNDQVETRGWDAVNERDFREWLSMHGARRSTIDSAIVKALYDLAFAYVDGNENTPSVEAGSMLMGAIRMGTEYRGFPIYRMNGGMGDVVFAPLYETLVDRGVDFRFFRFAKKLVLSNDKMRVDRVEVARQVDLVSAAAYAPLVDISVGGRVQKCWPADPDWSQVSGPHVPRQELERGGPEVATETYQRGADFDVVVVASPLGGRFVDELSAHLDSWQDMRAKVRTVATQSVQLWTTRTLPQMGWQYEPSVHAAYVGPLSGWADMSHLLPLETWPTATAPNGLVYLCGVVTDPVDTGAVFKGVSDWLDAFGTQVWPNTAEPAGFIYANILGADINQNFVKINDVESERYVLSVPGSSVFRIRSASTGFENVYAAGDWVYGSINGGCAEAAVQAGIDAAEGILRTNGIAIPLYPTGP